MSSNPGSFQSFDQRQQVVTARVVLRLRGRAVAVSTAASDSTASGFKLMRINTEEPGKKTWRHTQIVVQTCTIWLFFIVILFPSFHFGHVSDMSHLVPPSISHGKKWLSFAWATSSAGPLPWKASGKECGQRKSQNENETTLEMQKGRGKATAGTALWYFMLGSIFFHDFVVTQSYFAGLELSSKL